MFSALQAAAPDFFLPRATRALSSALGVPPYRLRRAMENHLHLSRLHFSYERRRYTLLTYAFAHASPLHLLANMIGLLSFGHNITAALGWRPFAALYLLGAAAGGAAHLAHMRALRRDADAVGASGGLCALAAFFMACRPRDKTLLLIFPVKNWVLLPLGVGVSAWGVAQYDGKGFVSHAGHLGGLVFGLLSAGAYLARRRF